MALVGAVVPGDRLAGLEPDQGDANRGHDRNAASLDIGVGGIGERDGLLLARIGLVGHARAHAHHALGQLAVADDLGAIELGEQDFRQVGVAVETGFAQREQFCVVGLAQRQGRCQVTTDFGHLSFLSKLASGRAPKASRSRTEWGELEEHCRRRQDGNVREP